MGMQLNIKDETMVRKAQEWAARDGRSVTATLRDLFERETERRNTDHAERLARMIAFTEELQAQVPEHVRRLSSKEIMDSIYDENEPDGIAR